MAGVEDQTKEVLSEEESRTLLRSRAERFAQKIEEKARDLSQVVTFRRGASRYAVNLTDLHAVRPLEMICLVPGASRTVPGVFHHRGEILSLHDLSALLDPNQAPVPDTYWVVICEVDGHRFGLLADEVSDVEEVSMSEVSGVPVSFGDRSGLFRGLLKEGSMVLDLPSLLVDPTFFYAF